MKHIFTLIFIAMLPVAVAQNDLTDIPPDDWQSELDSFQVHEGFSVNLFASEPEITNPIQMNFDSEGRLWVANSPLYPHIEPGQTEEDKIVILEDTTGDGVADKSTVFADHLMIPTAVMPGDGGVYVANSTELIHLSDTDGDGKADREKVILSGFGTEDTHHILHTFRWGPDSRLYMNQSIYIHSHLETPHGVRRLNGGGIWRLRPETLELDVLAKGFVNTWGHAFDDWGQSFATDGAYHDGVNYLFPGAVFLTSPGATRILNGLNPGSPKHCGLEIVRSRHLPDSWYGSYITLDFRGHRVCRFEVEEQGSGYTSREMPELIKSQHVAFRPVDVKTGPRGEIYILDWYNPIIQHGEVDFRDPRRDHSHGRVWRMTADDRPLLDAPKITDQPVEHLLDLLKSPEHWTRERARLELKSLGTDAVLPALEKWIAALDKSSDKFSHHQLEALWLHQSLRALDSELLETVLASPDHRARAAAVRVLTEWLDELSDPLGMLEPLAIDPHPRVRLEAVRALALIPRAEAAEFAMRALDHDVDKYLDYALWLTARELAPVWQPAFVSGQIDFGDNVHHQAFAIRSTGFTQGIDRITDRLANSDIPANQLIKVLELIAEFGGPNEMALVFNQLTNSNTDTARKRQLLISLLRAGDKHDLKSVVDLEAIAPLLESDDHDLRRDAVRAVGVWKIESLRPKVSDLAGELSASSDLRQSAILALVKLGGDDTRRRLGELASAPNPDPLRISAIAGLVQVDHKAAANLTVDYLQTAAPETDPSPLFSAFMNLKQGPAALAEALKDEKLPRDIAKIGVRLTAGSGRTEQALIDALSRAGGLNADPPELTPEMLSDIVQKVNASGDPSRGEAVFRRDSAQCYKCHAIGGAGGKLGPDLSSIGGSAQVDYLVESIYLPNKAIKENYHSVNVETKEGQLISGIKLRETETDLIVRDATDSEIKIPLADIEETRPGISMMPGGLSDAMTADELVDLVRFLSEIGRTEAYSVGTDRVARTWRALESTPEAIAHIRRFGHAVLMHSNEFEATLIWGPEYSTVSGHFPLYDMPILDLNEAGGRMTFLQTDLTAASSGNLGLRFNDTLALTAWLDGAPLKITRNVLTVPVDAGDHTLTIGVDRSNRKTPIRVELVDPEENPATAQWVLGK